MDKVLRELGQLYNLYGGLTQFRFIVSTVDPTGSRLVNFEQKEGGCRKNRGGREDKDDEREEFRNAGIGE